jgi:hypothetical protein
MMMIILFVLLLAGVLFAAKTYNVQSDNPDTVSPGNKKVSQEIVDGATKAIGQLITINTKTNNLSASIESLYNNIVTLGQSLDDTVGLVVSNVPSHADVVRDAYTAFVVPLTGISVGNDSVAKLSKQSSDAGNKIHTDHYTVHIPKSSHDSDDAWSDANGIKDSIQTVSDIVLDNIPNIVSLITELIEFQTNNVISVLEDANKSSSGGSVPGYGVSLQKVTDQRQDIRTEFVKFKQELVAFGADFQSSVDVIGVFFKQVDDLDLE